MKFSAKAAELGSVEALTKILSTVSRLSRCCVLRITPTNMCFIQNEDVKDHSQRLWVDVVTEHFFCEYRMEGMSPDVKEIYMEVMPDEILRILRSSVRAKSFKVKLTKKGNPLCPHLTFEVKLPCAAGSRFVSHDAPIHIIHQRNWTEYAEPPKPRAQVSIELPQVKTLQKVVHGMKSMSKNYAVLSANNDGEMQVRIETDSVTVSAYFSGLKNFRVEDPDDSTAGEPSKKELFSVRVDIKTLSSFLSSQQLTFCRLVLSIVHNRVAQFKIDVDEVKLQYFIPAVTL